jgi:hypothetical protein
LMLDSRYQCLAASAHALWHDRAHPGIMRDQATGAGRLSIRSGQRLGDEDAERMAGRVGVHAQRLLRVVAAVVQQPPAKA